MSKNYDPNWQDKVAAEAMNFTLAVQQNFLHGLTISRKYLPKDTPENRIKQLDYFIDASVGVCAYNIAKFTNPSKEMEDLVVLAIRQKFEYIRGELAKGKIRESLKLGEGPKLIGDNIQDEEVKS
jgi:hypothetical protein